MSIFLQHFKSNIYVNVLEFTIMSLCFYEWSSFLYQIENDKFYNFNNENNFHNENVT